MKELDYQVVNEKNNTRWKNRKDFVKNISWNKKNKIAILSLHFNNFNNTKNLLDYLSSEKNQNFDVVLIENSTKETEIDQLREYAKSFDNIIRIMPLSNVWSAWGYGLWMEYILNNGYEYFFLVEDDVVFLEKNVFSDMIEGSDNKKNITFILNCKNTRTSLNPKDKWVSNYIQTGWYPVNFLEKIGIINPRYFFRGEDFDWEIRLRHWIKKRGYRPKIIEHNYIHPYLKSINWNSIWFYFSIRNQLLTLKRHPLKYYKFLINLFFYLFTGITKTIVNRDNWILSAFFNALFDFFRNKYSFEYNTKKIKSFIIKRQEKEYNEWTDSITLKWITSKMYWNQKILVISWSDIEKNLSFSHNILNLFTQWMLASSSSTVFYPLTLLAPKVVYVQEFNLYKPLINISIKKNKKMILNVLWFILSLFLSIWLIIIIYLSIILYILFAQCLRRK